MKGYLRSDVFVSCILSVLCVGSAKNLTFCTHAYIPTTELCTQKNTIIQVTDVYVYDFAGFEYFNRDCVYQHGDYGEPLINVSPNGYDSIITHCDGNQACSRLWIPTRELTDGSDSNYIVMNYTCVKNTSTMILYELAGETFEGNSCRDNTGLHVISVYAVFTEDDCGDRNLKHVKADYFKRVKYECEHNDCGNLTAPVGRKRCEGEIVQSVGIRIVYRCNILPEEDTTTVVVITPTHTTVRDTTVEYTMTSHTTHISPSDSPSTAKYHSSTMVMTTDTVSGGVSTDGHDTGSDGQIGSGDSDPNKIGVIVGACVAALVMIVVVVLAFLCVGRKKNSRPGTTTPAFTDRAYSDQVPDNSTRWSPSAVENIYNVGDEDYSVVGPGLGGQSLGGSASSGQALGTSALGGHTADQRHDALYYNTLAVNQNSADYSLATGINVYSEVIKRHSEAHEMEIQDNVNYETGDVMVADEQITNESPEMNETELVDNAQYTQWNEKVN